MPHAVLISISKRTGNGYGLEDVRMKATETWQLKRRNFNMDHDAAEASKIAVADSLMKIAVKKYKNVYYIKSNATSPMHDTTMDGVHPGDWGYYLWAESVRKPIVRILRKYGIK